MTALVEQARSLDLAGPGAGLDRDVLVIVPARGGSKRLPGKNLMKLAGKSLPERTADALAAAGLANLPCLLSTDDAMIADEGRRLGWLVPWLRPAELSTDDASSLDVVFHGLDWWRDQTGRDPEFLLLLQVTTPFRRPADLAHAVRRSRDEPGLSGLVGVKSLWRDERHLFRADERGALRAIGYTPGVGPLVTPNGSIYLVRCSAFRRERTFFPRGVEALPMGPVESIDIDDADDWRIADALARVPAANSMSST